jgi:hypothetical protein
LGRGRLRELADTLFFIDVQTIVLHELGHALGMGHFGRSILVLDDGYGFVDLLVNPNSANLMNTNGFYEMRELAGTDVASFCELHANYSARIRARSPPGDAYPAIQLESLPNRHVAVLRRSSRRRSCSDGWQGRGGTRRFVRMGLA